jgi:predicted ester cyclase
MRLTSLQGNGPVRAVLRSPVHRLLSGRVVELHYTGRRSGRDYALPVQYARAGDRLVVRPQHAGRSVWWRTFRQPTPVRVRLRGALRDGTALAVAPGDPGWAELRRVYGSRWPRAAARHTGAFVAITLAAAATMSTVENKRVVRRMVAEVWRPGAAALGRYFAEPLRTSIAEHRGQLYDAFPDLVVEVEDLVAEADKVVARLRLSGTHTGTFAGRPATGRRVQWRSIRVYRLVDGAVVETWAVQDRLGLLRQLDGDPPADTVTWVDGSAQPTHR